MITCYVQVSLDLVENNHFTATGVTGELPLNFSSNNYMSFGKSYNLYNDPNETIYASQYMRYKVTVHFPECGVSRTSEFQVNLSTNPNWNDSIVELTLEDIESFISSYSKVN
ncbi:hypothetical protein [Vibrio comitans]|uniref:Uncharacterized protein n=1 Tax=Vibrio comitans NBRC 102076 TaxID=1219078 RepID=A0A4Y3INU4_9VIBR|nr:hypothetical protein [Vibrio comitans]GEA60755.1 hypothetical protein VCO01S_19480 [Vibrio comitans NBRC 102076]